jgi:hypothetical protein
VRSRVEALGGGGAYALSGGVRREKTRIPGLERDELTPQGVVFRIRELRSVVLVVQDVVTKERLGQIGDPGASGFGCRPFWGLR